MNSDFRFDNVQNEQSFSLDEPTQDELNPSPEKLPKKKKGLAALLGVILAFLGKSKFGLIFLKVIFPFLKFGKFLTTFLSMLLMIWIYAKTYGMTEDA